MIFINRTIKAEMKQNGWSWKRLSHLHILLMWNNLKLFCQQQEKEKGTLGHHSL